MIEFRSLRRYTLPYVEGKLLLDFIFNEAFFWREAAFLKDPWWLLFDAWLFIDAAFSDLVQEAWLLTEDLFFDRVDWLVMDRVACLVSEGLFSTLVFFTKLACFSVALLADLFNGACFLMGAIVCIYDQHIITRQPDLWKQIFSNYFINNNILTLSGKPLDIRICQILMSEDGSQTS